MKIANLGLLAFAMAAGPVSAQTTSVAVPAPTACAIVDSGPNYNVWQWKTFQVSPSGQVVSKIHQYKELASGLNYLDSNGLWVESKEKIEAVANGAAARQGQHTVIFANNLNTEGAIDMQCPDGKRLRSNILGLMYVDSATGKAIVIGELQDSEGELVADNKVLYPNAFDGVKADVQLTYRRDGIEQDVVLREQPPAPETFGLNSATTELEVFTEFIDPPTASVADATTTPGQETDQSVKWGVTSLGHGKAFSLDGQDAPTTVFKRYTTVNGRHFLLEKTRYQDIQVPLSKLPEQASNARRVHGLASLNPVLPKTPTAKSAARPVKLALGRPPDKGYVLDYNTLTTSYTNYTFQGDTTYYISGSLNLAGTNIFEPCTVIKYASGASIAGAAGSVMKFISGPYRPVIFTAMDDNTVGEGISGSSGSPSGYYADPALNLASMSAVTLGNFRIMYANRAISAGGASPVIYNAQLVNCAVAVSDVNGTAVLENVLFSNNKTNFNATSSANTIVAENATFNNSFDLINGSFANTSICLTNCAFVNITNLSGSIAASYNGFYQTPSVGSSSATNTVNPLQIVGAASCYLTNGCAFLGVGTTNVDAYSLIATKTTYAPIVFASTDIATVTNLLPQAQRDNLGSPNLGYHYDPLDYVFGGCVLSTNLTIAAGTAIGWYEDYGSADISGQPYGFALNDGANLTLNGNATSPCEVALFRMVQEGGNGNWTSYGYKAGFTMNGSGSQPMPKISAQFTIWSGLPTWGFMVDNWDYGVVGMANCEIYNQGCGAYAQSYYFTNCLMWRNQDAMWDQTDAASVTFQNCTLYNGAIAFCRYDGQSPSYWTFLNTTFDGTGFLIQQDNYNGNTNYTCADHNAYNTNNTSWVNYDFGVGQACTGTFEMVGAHDLMVTNYNWQTSWLGQFYLPTNSPLINAGSTTADLLGLYQFTTQTNQVKETNSIVDIGYHYVAAGTNGLPLDSNGDGIPDYIQDTNGNGRGPWMPLPVITAQPASQFVGVGSNATFSVAVSSLVPPACQWYFGANPLSKATNFSLTFVSAQETNDGYYSVIVTNPAGSVTSSAALLTVVVPCVLTTQPTNLTAFQGSNATFSVTATGTAPLTYQWWFNVTNQLAGATNASLTLTNVQLANAGNYTVVVTNVLTSVTSSNAILTVNARPVISVQPTNQTVAQGNSVTIGATATGSAPLKYQWWFNATNQLAGATNASLVLTNVQTTNSGNYSVVVTNNYGVATSAIAGLSVLIPVTITAQPMNQAVLQGSYATFSVTATGTAPLNYQWWFNATNQLAGATNASLALTNVQFTNAGNYTAVVTNAVSSVTSAVAGLTVVIPVAVAITVQPANQTVQQGSNVTISVAATGTAPVSYQWWLNATNQLAGATNASLVLTNAQLVNAGNYTVVVSNSVGSEISSSAALTVLVPPAITVPPVNVVAATGSNATFTVTATGAQPLSYQWYFNGVPLVNGIIGVAASCVAVANDTITTVVGNFSSIQSVAVDRFGNIYIADNGQNVNAIYKFGTNGILTVVAGNGSGSYPGDGRLATQVGLYPNGVAVDGSGNLYITDPNANAVRKVATNGIMTTLVDSTYLSGPHGVAVDSLGNVYIADSGHYIVRKVAANGVVTTVAGIINVSGYSGDNGPATNATLYVPMGIAVDSSGNLYIADLGNNGAGFVRKVDTNGIITTVAGTLGAYVNKGTDGWGDGGPAIQAGLNNQRGVAVDSAGNLYIADSGHNVVRMVTNGIITVVAGKIPDGNLLGNSGYQGDGGPAHKAYLSNPTGVCVGGPSGSLYIADTGNYAIRKVSGPVFNVAADGTLIIYGVQTNLAGSYQVVVSNAFGSAYCAAASLTVLPPIATPVIAPAGGTFGTQQAVAISCSTTGAVMHYTLNGNVPTQADPTNGSTLLIKETEILNVGAFAVGHAPSAISSAAFNITGAIAAGDKFTLGLNYNGGVWAAGTNNYSQLGDGTTNNRPGWVAVSNLTSGVAAISAGTNFSLALRTNGTVRAWGYNGSGQLGDGTTTLRATNVLVANLTSVAAIAAGGAHSLALLSNTTVRAWGNNIKGQLGNGNLAITTSKTNLLVYGLTNITAIAAGGTHSLALSNGCVLAWGDNGSYQLGDGTTATLRSSNVWVTNLNSVAAIAAGGSHSLALLSNGLVQAWGLNNGGQLGDGTTINRNTSVPVANLTSVVAIAAGTSHSLALLANGTVMAWGTNNFGQLGDGTTNQFSLTPVLVANLSNVVAIAAGSQHSAALESSGAVVVWGCTNYGMGGGYSSTPFIQQPTNPLTWYAPPTIVTQPSSVSSSNSQAVSLEVSVIGTMPMSYQWYSNSIALLAATNAMLTFSYPQPYDSGSYYVAVSNAAGGVISTTATLTVVSPPVFNTQPTGLTLSAGSTATFTVSVSGSSPLSYQWYGVGSGLLPGATGASLVITNVQATNDDNYYVVVTNTLGTVTSAYASLVVVEPIITSQPLSQSVTVGNNASFSVVAGGDASYQWYFNLEPIAGAINTTLLLTNVALSASGDYFVMVSNALGTVVSAIASLTVNPAVAVVAPTNLIDWWPAEGNALDVIRGSNGTLSASGVTYVAGEAGQAFHLDGANGSISFGGTAGGFGTTNFTIEFWMRSAGVGAFSEYPVLAKTTGCNSSAGFTVRLEGNGGDNPAPGTVVVDLGQAVGNYVRLQSTRVVNDGLFHHVAVVRQSTNLTLYLDGTYEASGSTTGLVSVGTSNILTAGTSPCVGADGGLTTNYFGDLDELSFYNRNLQASEIQSIYNAAGAGKLWSGPSITTQPTNQLLFVGNSATFSVAAGGQAPLSYQWYGCQAGLLSGATTANLTLPNLQLANSDSYFVVVSNSFGSTVSAAAALTVLNSTSLTAWELSYLGTTNVNLNASIDGSGWTILQEYLNGMIPFITSQPLNIIITQPRANAIVP